MPKAKSRLAPITSVRLPRSRRKPAGGRPHPAPLPHRSNALADGAYRQLYDLAPVPWIVLDMNGIVLDVNAACGEALGSAPAALLGTPLSMWAASESRAALLEHIRLCRGSRVPVESQILLRSRSGATTAVRLHSRPLFHQGRTVFPTVAIDLTEVESLERARRAAEQQRDRAEEDGRLARAADAAKDHLLARVSHELRNPLSPALLASSMLMTWQELPAQARDMAATIRRNIEVEARLIDDLLDVARATRGQLAMKRQIVDVHEILRRTIDVCVPEARARALTIELVLEAGRHTVNGDSTRLEQVFWNLVNNAIKFSHRGGQIVVRTSSDAAGVLLVTVRDFGVGMDTATQLQLFQPFTEPRTPSAGRPGLGLGLTIARSIIELHGGQIWASSEAPNMGSTFEVQLVTLEPGMIDAPPPPRAVTVPAPTDAPHRGRVLIVEDHDDTGSLLASVLGHSGYQVTLAHTLAEGLAALDTPWDVVLSDIGLGDGSGLEIARRVGAASAPRPRHVVALSGYGAEHDLKASRDAGFDNHLVKPIDLEKLLRLLEMPPPHARP